MTGSNIARNANIPPWPELDARQQREALAATWLPRLIHGLGGAAALAGFTALASWQGSGFGWDVAFASVLAIGFGAAYLHLREGREPGPWIAPLGLATLALTQINIAVFLADRLGGSESGIADPAYALIALVAGTLWALRMHLSIEGFTSAAVITGAILWLPWVARTDASLEFSLIGAACIAAGAQMRRVEAEQAYDAYRRQTLWPVLWRKRLDLAVTRELAAMGALPYEPAPTSSEERGEFSIVRLAAALAPSRAEARYAPVYAREARKADSRV